jgi:RHH-type transcriptional regulator, rel operon repressor / antitoxin RelB
MPKIMISARVDEKLNESLEVLAEATQRSKAFLISDALQGYVDRQAWQLRKTDDSFREADESGELTSHEAVSDWLSKWSPDNRLPPPGPDIFKSPRAKAIKRA